MYEPFRIFLLAAIPFMLIGIRGIGRFLYSFWFLGEGTGKIQSLIIASILITIGFTFVSLGIIGDVVARNRVLIEENLRLTKQLLYDRTPDRSSSSHT